LERVEGLRKARRREEWRKRWRVGIWMSLMNEIDQTG
jgi:hypothetical protein